MSVLLWLTLSYATVLVVGLAVGLTVAWLRLRAIDRSILVVRGAFARTRDATAGLHEGVAPVRERLASAVAALQPAAVTLDEVDAGLPKHRVGAGVGGDS